MPYPETDTAQMLIVIAAGDDGLACALAHSLAADKNALQGKLRRPSVMMDWRHTTTHMPTGNRDEIAACLETVLDEKKHPMMIISGYQDTPEWNDALRGYMKTRRLSATFIDAGGGMPPDAVLALFNAHDRLPGAADTDETIDQCRRAIKQARQNSAIPADGPRGPLC